jgi:hypothetical protein
MQTVRPLLVANTETAAIDARIDNAAISNAKMSISLSATSRADQTSALPIFPHIAHLIGSATRQAPAGALRA